MFEAIPEMSSTPKIGRLRSEAETMSFVGLSRFLNDQLQNPIMRNNPRLRLWCLAAKGYTDIEIRNRVGGTGWWLKLSNLRKRALEILRIVR